MTTKSIERFQPISYKNVKINDNFWTPRIDINREFTLPYQYEQCKTTGRLDAFKLDWETGKEVPHIFWDSDAAKWIEAASYSLAQSPDEDLESLVDQVIDLIASAQQEDGYLNIYYTSVEPEKRWTDLEGGHELYCAGHMMEAAVAYYNTTGKRKLLDVVCRYADYIETVFGTEPGKKRGYPGHEEIELALVKLYRVTNEERYLKLSQYFVDERGKDPKYFDEERRLRNNEGFLKPVIDHLEDLKISEYHQTHKPVREQEKAVGHSVRAMYLYAAMADLAYEVNDESLYNACKRLWSNLVNKRMYITGGIGSTERNEGFTYDYDLPNLTSYAETCAAIGLVFWNHRLVQYDCDSSYTDLLERALYNAVLAGVSLDGKKFFYANPLESNGDKHRSEWFDIACCPPNIARLIASLGKYIYSQSEQDIAVHLYVQSEAETSVGGQDVTLVQKTNYPWDSVVNFTVKANEATTFGLKLRIPDWSPNYKLFINGQEVKSGFTLDKGYLRVERIWNNEDTVELHLEMPVVRNYAHPNVKDCVGKVSLQRGPFIYCLEQVDHQDSVFTIKLPKDAEFNVQYQEDLLNGVNTLEANAYAVESNQEDLYVQNESPGLKNTSVRAVPYYAWDNRKEGAMVVWIKE